MSLTKYGGIVQTAGNSGVLKTTNSLLALATTVLSLESFKLDGKDFVPILAVQQHARVNRTEDDFVDTVHLLSPEDAGALAGMLAAGADRLGEKAFEAFTQGFNIGLER